MSRVGVAQVIEIVAGIGVVLGLVLVAYELRQNSELMRIQVNQARADAAMMSLDQSFNSDYIPEIRVKIRDGIELTAEEWLRYVDFFRGWNRNQDNVLSQWEAGMLSDNTPRSVEGFACGFIGLGPIQLKAWEETKPGYTDSYVSFIESALKSCD